MDTKVAEVTEPHHKGINIDRIVHYADLGLSDKEIAKQLGCGRTNIQHRLAKYGYSKDRKTKYQQRAADIFEVKAFQAVKQVTQAKLEKARPGELAMVAGTFYDKARLIRGESTVIVSTASDYSDRIGTRQERIDARQAEIDSLKSELIAAGSEIIDVTPKSLECKDNV